MAVYMAFLERVPVAWLMIIVAADVWGSALALA